MNDDTRTLLSAAVVSVAAVYAVKGLIDAGKHIRKQSQLKKNLSKIAN